MDGLFSTCKVLYVDHLAVTTSDLEATLQDYLSLAGAKLLKGPGVNTKQRVSYAFVQLPGGYTVEILAADDKSPIDKHLENGGGPYHFCYAVADIIESIDLAERHGARLVAPPTADVAFDGRKVAFLFHNTHGIFELVQAFPEGKSWPHPPAEIQDQLLSPQNDIEKKLQQVFAQIFPTLDPSSFSKATMEKTEGWDSLAHIQLIMALESVFSINIPVDNFEQLTSYAAIYIYLEEAG